MLAHGYVLSNKTNEKSKATSKNLVKIKNKNSTTSNRKQKFQIENKNSKTSSYKQKLKNVKLRKM